MSDNETWVGGVLKHERLWQFYSEKSRRWLIGWSYYGQSATGDNLRDLAWLLRTIFQMKPSAFVATYTTEEA